jgi:hypothetical protein
MPWVGFEPKIPASERAKTVHDLDRSATVTGDYTSMRVPKWESQRNGCTDEREMRHDDCSGSLVRTPFSGYIFVHLCVWFPVLVKVPWSGESRVEKDCSALAKCTLLRFKASTGINWRGLRIKFRILRLYHNQKRSGYLISESIGSSDLLCMLWFWRNSLLPSSG